MTAPETPKTPAPLRWDESMRSLWREMESHRNRKNLHLGIALAPYLICPLIMLMGLGAQGSDTGVMIAFGGGLFLIFLLLSPVWLIGLLSEWKAARGKFMKTRRAFWEHYGVDPVTVYPPPVTRVPPPKAPWE